MFQEQYNKFPIKIFCDYLYINIIYKDNFYNSNITATVYVRIVFLLSDSNIWCCFLIFVVTLIGSYGTLNGNLLEPPLNWDTGSDTESMKQWRTQNNIFEQHDHATALSLLMHFNFELVSSLMT